MAAASRRAYITKKHLQSLVGLANHLAKVVRAARIFICHLLAALRAATKDAIRITPLVEADLAWFARHVAASSSHAVIPVHMTVMRVWADACLTGAGASEGVRFYEHVFSNKSTSQHNITQLEALNCVAAVRTFVSKTCAGGTESR